MKKLWSLFSQVVTVLVAAYFVTATLKPEWLNRRAVALPGVVSVLEAPAVGSALPAGSFRAAAKRASAAVVSINTSKAAKANPRSGDPWFQFFFGEGGQSGPQEGLGSGVIVSASGYILTNNHVVEGADEIEVVLRDGRKAKAKTIGTDPESDLALLKIELTELPVIVFGSSDALQVGDQVLAIGNPFGVGQTVTGGIVSALGRNELGINTFENFIQTDAAINPGNSGGALVDVQGNLLGINTAIYSRSGGSLGIGFAIPATTARTVMDGLVKDGVVTRGWIGIDPQELTAELAESFNVQVKQGVVVNGVLQGAPSEKAGLRPGDVITAIDGKAVKNRPELLAAVAALKPGSSAKFSVARKAESIELTIKPAARPRQPMRK